MYDKFLTITNPNPQRQGINPFHDDNPFHNDLTSKGWKYSHTTPITHKDTKYAIHTYKLHDWNIGVICKQTYEISCSKSASNTHWTIKIHNTTQMKRFKQYLTRKTSQINKQYQ